jgi:biotin transport system substrate-specific component
MTQKPLFRLVLSALFTALIAVGSYLAIPFVPVPLVLANFFALLAGLLLGPLYGGLAVLLYLVLGALGLPVFSGGSGGLGHFAGPTGGFLLGYLLAAVVAGLTAHGPKGLDKTPGLLRLALAGLLGLVALYALGLPWFQAVLAAKFTTLWAAFLFMGPYLVGDAVKVVAAVLLSRSLLPLLK